VIHYYAHLMIKSIYK